VDSYLPRQLCPINEEMASVRLVSHLGLVTVFVIVLCHGGEFALSRHFLLTRDSRCASSYYYQ
jgi:hypothetical protein